MKSPRHILRSIAAIVLLGIFISIHVAKAFHTHQSVTVVAKFQEAAEQVKASTDCAICDYHFTKDSSGELTPLESVISQSYISSIYLFYESPVSSSIGLHYSDRGPPALV